jgi:hypothetical protein
MNSTSFLQVLPALPNLGNRVSAEAAILLLRCFRRSVVLMARMVLPPLSSH